MDHEDISKEVCSGSSPDVISARLLEIIAHVLVEIRDILDAQGPDDGG
jgi:hypothetical protein